MSVQIRYQLVNKLQAESGLNRGDFARALGYHYDSFKHFYSGRHAVSDKLYKALLMWQLLTVKQRRLFLDNRVY